jgi:hypothetical protein
MRGPFYRASAAPLSAGGGERLSSLFVNPFGVDVRGLDIEAFLSAARHVFPLLALAWLALLVRVRRAGWLLLGVVLANAYVWFETNWPLQRLYALGPSNDRLGNVAFCQMVAVGRSPLSSPQLGHVQFEPLWSLLMGALSGWNTARLLELYAFMPLVMVIGTVLSLYFALRPLSPATASAGDEVWSSWERVTIAAMATLLFSAPLDFTGPYRVPWAMSFLLKPNHALGFVLAPWVARRVATTTGWRDRLIAAVLLHALGWAFVIHMGLFSIGLVCAAALAAWLRSPEAGRDIRDVAAVIGLNLLLVSPYLVILFTSYGIFDHGPRQAIPPWSPHALEATAREAGLFALAVWGAVVAWRRDRMGRVWAGQMIGALVFWLCYYALHFLELAKERDDAYYWVRFTLAITAGVGLWDLGRRAATALRRAPGGMPPKMVHALSRPEWRAVALAIVLLPWSMPYWYDPARMDPYFAKSCEPIPDLVRSPVAALVERGDRVGVLAGDPAISRWAAALAGFRVLQARDFPMPKQFALKASLLEDLLRGDGGERARTGALAFGVTHLLVTPELLQSFPGTSLSALRQRRDLREIQFTGDARGDFVAVFELSAPG